MLSNVSWAMYLEAVSVLLLIYYSVIGVKFYKNEIKALFNRNLQNVRKTNQPASQNSIKETDQSFDELESIVHDLRYSVLEKAGHSITQPELLKRLQFRLMNYEGLQRPAYRAAINNYIIINAKEINGAVFSEDELNSAWDTLLQ